MEDLFCYWFLLFLKASLGVVDLILDSTIGFSFTKGTRGVREAAKSSQKTAQMVNILWKAHPVDMIPHGLINFLYVHEKYLDPKYILENKNVTLYFMDKETVTFCVTDPAVDVYDLTKFPFVFYAHYDQAKKFIIMQQEDFFKLADEVGDPKIEVSLLQFTARCGSTLISQMISRIPKTRSMSEPWCLSRLEECYNLGYFSWDTYNKLIRSCMKLLCKVEPGMDIDRIFIKMTCISAPQFEIIHKLFPEMNLVFNTRHPRSSIHSLMKVLKSVNNSLYAKSGLYWNQLVHQLSYPHRTKYDYISKMMSKFFKPMTYEEGFVHVYASSLACYLETREIFKHVVLYENLIANPEQETEKLLNSMNIPLSYKKEAMSALAKDSQGKRFGAMGETVQLSLDMWGKVEHIFDMYYLGLRKDMTLDEFKKIIYE